MRAEAELGPSTYRHGDDRRRPSIGYRGPERRVADPTTEQDHPEQYELPRDSETVAVRES